jgi:hypothetical protein
VVPVAAGAMAGFDQPRSPRHADRADTISVPAIRVQAIMEQIQPSSDNISTSPNFKYPWRPPLSSPWSVFSL